MNEKYTQDPPSTSPVVLAGRQKTAGRSHYWLSGSPIFNVQQLANLKALVDEENSEALIEGGPGTKARRDLRRTRVRWLNPSAHKWVYQIIWTEANKANQLFDFDVVPMHDTIQLARYDADESGFFDWHADTIPSDLTRKISISVPLNSDNEFEGGQFEFGGSGRNPRQIAGRPIMFPSWLLHRVTPVTRGRRYSLVAWIRGPNWR